MPGSSQLLMNLDKGRNREKWETALQTLDKNQYRLNDRTLKYVTWIRQAYGDCVELGVPYNPSVRDWNNIMEFARQVSR